MEQKPAKIQFTLDPKLKAALLAKCAHDRKTVSQFMRETVREIIDDLEDRYLSERVAERIRSDSGKYMTLEEVRGKFL